MQSLGATQVTLASPLACFLCQQDGAQLRLGAVDVQNGTRATRILPLGGVLTATLEQGPTGPRVQVQLVCRAGHKTRLVVEPLMTGEVVVSHKV